MTPRRYAFVVPAEGAVAADAGRVRDDGDERRTVAELAEEPRLEKRPPRERDLAPQGAVELRRMAARLVELQRDLARAEKERARYYVANRTRLVRLGALCSGHA